MDELDDIADLGMCDSTLSRDDREAKLLDSRVAQQ